MRPDYTDAANAALLTLIKHKVSYAPVDPLPILKAAPGVLVLSYADMASTIGVERSCVLNNISAETRDATTVVDLLGSRRRYLVGYNRQLPTYVTDRALARELGHIILGHDGTRPEDVRTEEATFFARHLLCPRPLVCAMQDAGIRITSDFLGNITGCYDRCQTCLRTSPAVRTDPNLNRMVRDQFAFYVSNLIDFYPTLVRDDRSPEVDFGSYMEGYEE